MVMMIITSILLGCGVGTMVVGLIMWNTNRIGDSKGTFRQFTECPMRIINKERMDMFEKL